MLNGSNDAGKNDTRKKSSSKSKNTRGTALTVLTPVAAVLLLVLALAIALPLSGCIGKNGDKSGSKTVVRRDISGDTPYADSILYANDSANGVQVAYTDGQRRGVKLKNLTASMVSDLTNAGNMGFSYLANAEGKHYFDNSMDLYVIDSDGTEWTDRGSATAGRFNTTRLGYYYYETRIQEYSFGLTDPEKALKEPPVKLADFTEDWETNMVDLSQKANSSMTLKLKFPTNAYVLKSGMAVARDSTTTVRITMKVTGSAKTAFFVFTDTTSRSFNDRQKRTFSVSNDGEYHDYYIDIADDLKGDLTSYRLEFQGEKGDTVVVTAIEGMAIGNAPDLKTNKIMHVFSDKIHQELRLCGAADVDNIVEYGQVIRIPEKNVDAIEIMDAAGKHSGLDFDPKTVIYAGIHVKNVGVVGLILPDIEGNTDRLTVAVEDGCYVIRQVCGEDVSMIRQGNWVTLYNRLYNDMSDNFEGLAAAAEIERAPLNGIEVTSTNSGCGYVGYDKIRGLYRFYQDGADFSTAYYLDQNGYKTAAVKVVNDSAQDRSVYFCFNTVSGALECAALADGDGNALLPIPIEVCKNFCGEYEDRFYDPSDASYGDSYFPMVVKSGETLTFTEHHMYQNWGSYPLKQLSSIQFHVGYYHLSTGVSESNCIAPYYVYGKDGWILPDFRGCSSTMWAEQPQFNAVGVTKLVSHYGTDGTYYQSEYTGSKINSYGPTYADLEYSYTADDGSYDYTVRHMEFPHTDESRTYYTLDLTFKKDLTITEVRRDFTLLMFNSRTTAYHWLTFTDDSGTVTTVDLGLGGPAYNNEYVKLQKGSFWYTWNNITEPSHVNPLNYGVVVRDYDITIGGKAFKGNFVVKNCSDGTYNFGYLTLDLGKTTFKKGDHIRMSFVLIPWGNLDWESHENMDKLYEDCVTSPLTVTAEIGTVASEKWLPRVNCVDGEAVFTVSGGRGNTPVRVDGFTLPDKPLIYIWMGEGSAAEGGNADDNEGWTLYDNSVVTNYDGYMIHFNEDGTYGFSFVFGQESPEDSVTFRVVGADYAAEKPAATDEQE